jgi:sulfoquinovosidase
MVTFHFTQTELSIKYLGLTLLTHSIDAPSVYVGYGEATIDAYRGNYHFDHYDYMRIPLHQFDVQGQSVKFYNESHDVTISFEVINDRLIGHIEASSSFSRFWLRIHAAENEKVYGAGEQGSYFNLRGRNFPLWTSESGVGRDPKSLTTFYANLNDKAGGDYYHTYYPEPTYVSSLNYFLHVNSFAYADFNFKHNHFHELYFWEVPTSFVISKKSSLMDVVTDLNLYTGRPPMLPEFVLDGMILGVQGGTETVLGYLNQALDAGVKVSGLWCQDWAGHNYTSFGKRLYWNWQLNENVYPNLPETIVELKKKNIHFMTYICPFLLENESLFNEAQSYGYLAKTTSGHTYLEDFGEFNCGIVDLTHPDGFHWYKGIIKKNLIDLGIEGWMADFGEYLPIDCVLHNGVDAKLMHNEWPVLWAKCNYEAVKEAGKLGEIFYFMRAGAHGSQHYATSLWAGDQSVNWEVHDGIASVIPLTLSSAMMGNVFTHSDIGGYTSLHGNIRTQQLFERWLEMNVFSTYMRTHEGNRPTENFQFYQSQETLKLMKRMTEIRVLLKPYIKHLFEEAVQLGYPVQRPYVLHYQEDPNALELQFEYLFGSDVLIKPVVLEHQTTQTLYLPKDEWIHLWSNQHFMGGVEVSVPCPIGYPPVFYKKHSKFASLFESITTQYGFLGETR